MPLTEQNILLNNEKSPQQRHSLDSDDHNASVHQIQSQQPCRLSDLQVRLQGSPQTGNTHNPEYPYSNSNSDGYGDVDDAGSFMTASSFCDDEEDIPDLSSGFEQEDTAWSRDHAGQRKAVVVAVENLEESEEMMANHFFSSSSKPSAAAFALMLSYIDNSEGTMVQKTIVTGKETIREPLIKSPTLSFTETAIRVASPFLPQWIALPSMLLPPLSSHNNTSSSSSLTTNHSQQVNTSKRDAGAYYEQEDPLAIELQPLGLKAPPKGPGRARRRVVTLDRGQDEENEQNHHAIDDPSIFEYAPSAPTSTVNVPCQFQSYWRPLSSFAPESIYSDRDTASTLYEESIRAARRYSRTAPSYAASLLSTRIRMDTIEEEGDEDPKKHAHHLHQRHTEAAHTIGGLFKFSIPSLSGFWGGHDHGHDHRHGHHHRHGGAESMERFSTYITSTGQAAIGYLADSVVPTTADLAQRGANSTWEVIAAGLQLPGVILQSTAEVLPRIFHLHHSSHHHRPAHSQQQRQQQSTEPLGDDNQHPRFVFCPRTISAPELLHIHDKIATGNVSTPDAAHFRDHSYRRSSSDLGLLLPPHQENLITRNNNKKRPRSRHQRRYPLQTIPGPEGLDPRIRQELEAQGFAALGLRDGTEGRDWRNWWDPRRYGLPKYIICHEVRAPRPCTVILLAILVVCIVFPVVFRRR